MPDLVLDAQGRVHRSRRRFRFIVALAAGAFVLAAAAFTWSLTGLYGANRHAIAQAHTATDKARAATREATAAAAEARHAVAIADQNRAELCGFLGAVKGEPIDEQATARRLFLTFGCGR